MLPKSVNVDRLRSNIDIVGWQLPQEDFDRLNKLEPQVRVGGKSGEGGKVHERGEEAAVEKNLGAGGISTG